MSTGTRFCPSCGKPVSSDARYCTTCGVVLSARAPTPVPSYSGYQGPYQPPHHSNTAIIIAVIVIVVLVVAVAGAILTATFFAPFSTTQITRTLVNGQITVPAGGDYDFPFGPPSGATRIIVSGTFTASGGGGSNIEVFVFDQTNFVNWKNGNKAMAYYDSGPETTGSFSVTLPVPGLYHLDYSNTFSVFSSKNVQTTANLSYSG